MAPVAIHDSQNTNGDDSAPHCTAGDVKTPKADANLKSNLNVPGSIARSSEITFRPSPPVFEDKLEERQYLKERMALAFRIFAEYGFDEGIAGHITIRDPVDPSSFWVNPLGLHFSLIKASDLIRVSHDGDILEGGPRVRLLNRAAFAIHSAIHSARPDVICAAHSHSVHGKAFAILGIPLEISTQDSCAFWNDHILYDQFNGVVLAAEEGSSIATALGNKKAAILQNHGLLTCGKTIEEAVFWFVSLDKCCYSQMLAEGTGRAIKKIGDEEAEFTYKTVGASLTGWFSGVPLFDWIERKCGSDYKD